MATYRFEMAAILPYLYLVRPREAVLALKATNELWCEHTPWFAQAHVWLLRSAGNHDWERGLEGSETHLKLVFVARVHEQRTGTVPTHKNEFLQRCAKAERSFAQALFGNLDLTHEVFDQFWSLERVGSFVEDVDFVQQRLPVESMRAVRGPTERMHPVFAPAGEVWQATIQSRPRDEARIAAAVRWALAWMHRDMPDLELRCELTSDVALIGREALDAAARHQGWEPTKDGALRLRVVRTDDWAEIELDFTVRGPKSSKARRAKVLRSGGLIIEVTHDERPQVESASLTTTQLLDAMSS